MKVECDGADMVTNSYCFGSHAANRAANTIFELLAYYSRFHQDEDHRPHHHTDSRERFCCTSLPVRIPGIPGSLQ